MALQHTFEYNNRSTHPKKIEEISKRFEAFVICNPENDDSITQTYACVTKKEADEIALSLRRKGSNRVRVSDALPIPRKQRQYIFVVVSRLPESTRLELNIFEVVRRLFPVGSVINMTDVGSYHGRQRISNAIKVLVAGKNGVIEDVSPFVAIVTRMDWDDKHGGVVPPGYSPTASVAHELDKALYEGEGNFTPNTIS